MEMATGATDEDQLQIPHRGFKCAIRDDRAVAVRETELAEFGWDRGRKSER